MTSLILRCVFGMFAVPSFGIHIGRQSDANNVGLSKSLRTCLNDYASKLNQVRSGLGEPIRMHPLEPGIQSNRSIVLGAGMGTTGTGSLTVALTQLLKMHVGHFTAYTEIWRAFRRSDQWNKRCHEFARQYDYTSEVRKLDVVLDSPCAESFINLFLAFPNAKWILTERPAADWVRSRAAHHPYDLFPMQEPCGYVLNHMQEQNWTVNDVATIYIAQNEFMRCAVPSDRMLSFNVWTASDTRMSGLMQELSDFVGRDFVPGKTFPGGSMMELPDMTNGSECAAIGDLTDLPMSDFGMVMKRLAAAGCEP